MSKEQYVTSKVAKLLREKGFRGDCIAYYNNDGKRYLSINAELHPLPCPTQAVACRWLREEKGIYISADIYKDSSNDADGNVVDEWTYWAWTFYWLPSGNIGDEEGSNQFDSYEDAVEAALEYVLKNLI